ncbi:MAG: hypothetical protein BJ554DRAFT_7142, partial [Olpidium bornovanus]
RLPAGDDKNERNRIKTREYRLRFSSPQEKQNTPPASPSMAASTSAPAQTNDPNQTIYVRNLPEKLQKEELKRCLYELFSAYGRIMDIVALKTEKMRGQAFVVFREVSSAAASLKALNGFMFFEKPM